MSDVTPKSPSRTAVHVLPAAQTKAETLVSTCTPSSVDVHRTDLSGTTPTPRGTLQTPPPSTPSHDLDTDVTEPAFAVEPHEWGLADAAVVLSELVFEDTSGVIGKLVCDVGAIHLLAGASRSVYESVHVCRSMSLGLCV